MIRTTCTLLVCSALLWSALTGGETPSESQWFKGNTHTHTLWSDGDAAPEVAAAWYRDHGYDFLVLSDHNILSEGERWFPVSEDGTGRLKPAELDGLIEAFGESAVELRERDGKREMRLLTLKELRERFEKPDDFLFVQGEEITTSFRSEGETPISYPVHVNAVNITSLLAPPTGDSVIDVMNRCVDAVVKHGQEVGRPVLAHVNHPNFGWGITWEELAQVRGDRFFEVYNGHQGVRNHGDPAHPETDEMWDLALVLRLTELGLPPLYAVATDDAHNYHGQATAQPGRGWVVVRARKLSGDAIVEAMKRGDFYASSGVSLNDVTPGENEYRVAIEAEPDIVYTTRFIGTRRLEVGLGPVGEALLETTENPAIYTYRGDELYVRAVVVSSRDHPNPFAAGDKETAWCQPVVR